MLGVAGGDRHPGILSDGGDERIVKERLIRKGVGGQNTGSWQVEREDPAGEGGQGVCLEPPAKDCALGGVGAFLGHDPKLDLSDGEGGLVTIVCRYGRVVPGPQEFFWLMAWRYSNHHSLAFDGDVYLVTEHGWTGCRDKRAGFTPALGPAPRHLANLSSSPTPSTNP